MKIHRLFIIAHRYRGSLGALVVLLLALIAANLLSLRLHSSYHEIAVGFRADRHFLEGFFKQEEDAQGRRYRWTRAESSLIIDDFVATPRPLLVLDVGGIPPVATAPRLVALRLDGEPWLTLPVRAEPRRYALLLPPDVLQDGDLRLNLSGPASPVPPDPRAVGIRLDAVAVGWPPGAWALPTGQTLLVQWAIVALTLAGAWRLALSRRVMTGAAGVLVLLLAWMTGYDPYVAAEWQQRLLLASMAALIFVWGVFPRMTVLLPGSVHDPTGRRAELRTLLLLMLAVLFIRLFALLYPTFDTHDWYIHEDRLHLFENGAILLFDKPAEFSNRVAIVPPAFYVLVAPLTTLTTDTVPTTQGLYGFLDGISVLLLALLVRQIGGSARAARLALLLLALLPIQFTALWWGFGPQVIGQALFVLLAVLVAHGARWRAGGQTWRGSTWPWLVAGVLFTVIILTHNGVTLLGGFCLAVYVALVWWFHRERHTHWLGWASVIAASGIAALLLLYIDVVALQLQGVADNERLAFTREDIFRVKYTLGSLCASFQPLSPLCDQHLAGTAAASVPPQVGATLLSLLLPLVSLGFLVWRTRGLHRLLVLSWLLSAGLFFAVDLASGLQVRYAYFIAPLLCAGLALLLDRLATRHRWGWLVAVCLLGLVAMAGLTLWYQGVVPALKPSLRLLTH